jgi:hypothetical protein
VRGLVTVDTFALAMSQYARFLKEGDPRAPSWLKAAVNMLDCSDAAMTSLRGSPALASVPFPVCIAQPD